MIQKRPLDLRRLRSRPPRGFGWLDHRLLRHGYLARCSAPATALYCLLVCASDERGLSFYSDQSVCARLGLEPALLPRVRRELVDLGLVAYGTYDLTNQATLRDWPAAVTAADLGWGVVSSAWAAAVGCAVALALR